MLTALYVVNTLLLFFFLWLPHKPRVTWPWRTNSGTRLCASQGVCTTVSQCRQTFICTSLFYLKQSEITSGKLEFESGTWWTFGLHSGLRIVGNANLTLPMSRRAAILKIHGFICVWLGYNITSIWQFPQLTVICVRTGLHLHIRFRKWLKNFASETLTGVWVVLGLDATKDSRTLQQKNKEIKNCGNEITKLEVTNFLSSGVFQIQDIAQKNGDKVTL